MRDAKTALQEWAQARGLPTPVYREVERTGPHHDPQFRVAVDAAGPGAGRRHRRLQARRGAERGAGDAGARRRAADMKADEPAPARGRDALRLRRADRRAQCRQIDAGQRAGRRQGLDRHRTRCRRRARSSAASPSRATRRSSSSTRPASSRRSAGSTAPWSTTAWGGAHDADLVALLIDAKRGHRRRGATRSSTSSPTCAQPKMLVLNKIDLVAAREAAGARAGRQRARDVRATPSWSRR